MIARRGFSLVEAVISAGVLGVLVIGALEAMGHAARGRQRIADVATAARLAEDLAAEIAAQAFHDPQTASTDLGPDAGETGATRSLFDDVDDYHALVDSPPRSKTGVQLADSSWSRMVEAEFVIITIPRGLEGEKLPTTLKRITIVVSRSGKPLATRVVLRARDAAGVMP